MPERGQAGNSEADERIISQDLTNLLRLAIPALAFHRHTCYGVGMSLVTLEVEIDHGRVIPRGSEPLPEKGTGLLTLLPDPATIPHRGSVSGFIEKWAGAFSMPQSTGDDPRLAYLLGKHAS
jgi:hypothetical protein